MIVRIECARRSLVCTQLARGAAAAVNFVARERMWAQPQLAKVFVRDDQCRVTIDKRRASNSWTPLPYFFLFLVACGSKKTTLPPLLTHTFISFCFAAWRVKPRFICSAASQNVEQLHICVVHVQFCFSFIQLQICYFCLCIGSMMKVAELLPFCAKAVSTRQFLGWQYQ